MRPEDTGDRWHGSRGALTCTPGRALARPPSLPPSRSPARPPAYPVPAAASQSGAAARGQRQRRPTEPPARASAHARSPLRRSPPRAAVRSRLALFTHACRPLLLDQDGGRGRAQSGAREPGRPGGRGSSQSNGRRRRAGLLDGLLPAPAPWVTFRWEVARGAGAGNRGWEGGRERWTAPDPILGSAEQVCKLPSTVLSRMSEPI